MLEHKYMIYSIQMSMRTMLPSPTVGLWQEQRVVKLWYDTGTVLGTSSHHHEKLKITELNSISSRIVVSRGRKSQIVAVEAGPLRPHRPGTVNT